MVSGISMGEAGGGGSLSKWTTAAIGALTSQRIRSVWVLAAAGWILFGGFRVGLLIARWDVLVDADVSEFAQCLITGLRYDAVPIGFAMAPLAVLLSLAPASAFGRKWFRRTVVGYGTALMTIAIFTEVVGVAFFLHFGARLNWTSMAYFGHFRELAIYIWNVYPVWLLAISTILAICGGWLLLGKVFWRGRQPNGKVWVRLVCSALLVGLCVLAARGGLDHHPLRHDTAYFSENNIINQITFNNFYTFGRAAMLLLEDGSDESRLHSLPPASDAGAVATEMFFQPADVPIKVPNNPLWRRSETALPRTDYNVVMIVMEGMSGRPVGALGNRPSHTPHFDRLCDEGLYFSRMYAVGPRTRHGLTGVLCGHPDLGGQSILKRKMSQGTFLTLPKIMHDRGYRTLFVYGGDPNFDNMQEFFTAGGIDTIVAEEKMRADEEPGNWGVSDEIIFRHAHRSFERMGTDKFFGVILTVSNHLPYEVPLDRTEMLPHDTEDNKRLNAYRYADWALDDYFRTARKADYFKRTIFILVSDHGRELDHRPLIDVPGYRVPCVFYAPGIVPERKVATIASQTDIAPTLLGLLGGSFEHCFFGRNLLTVPPDDGFALLHEDDRLGIVRDALVVILPPRQTARVFRTDGPSMEAVAADELDAGAAEALQRQMVSYYQTARHVYIKRSYYRPGQPAEIATTPRVK